MYTNESEARYALVGSTAAMQAVARVVAEVAPSGVPVLVLGETGTGKEVVARALHAQSDRAAGPFVAVNCAVTVQGWV